MDQSAPGKHCPVRFIAAHPLSVVHTPLLVDVPLCFLSVHGNFHTSNETYETLQSITDPPAYSVLYIAHGM
jgi:hypothetical protein